MKNWRISGGGNRMIYLNNGATSWPKPQCVTNTVKKALEALPCSAYRSGLHCSPLIHQCLKTSPRGTVRISLSRFTIEEEVEDTTRG